MGSRSTIAIVIGMLASMPAYAQRGGPPKPPVAPTQQPAPAPTALPPAGPGPLPAADAAKEGIDRYHAGDYAGAVEPLTRAVEMEPNNFEYRFTLAQALRQAGNCSDALPHYEQALALAPAERAVEVKQAIAGCSSAATSQQPATPTPEPTPPPAEPHLLDAHGGTSGTDAALLVGAGAGLAAGACLFLAAYSDDGDADAAARYEDATRISARADRMRIASYVTAGAGLVLGVIAIYRIKVSNEGTQLSFAPRKGGGSLVLASSW